MPHPGKAHFPPEARQTFFCSSTETDMSWRIAALSGLMSHTGVAIATGQKTTLVASGLRLVPRRVARRCKITEARLWVSDARLGFIGNQRKCLKRYVPFVPVPE